MLENIYSSQKRLKWIKNRVSKDDRIVEIGCGTGFMITYPLAMQGFKISGYDRCEKSINYAKNSFLKASSFENVVNLGDPDLRKKYSAIVCSEVLEHCDDSTINQIFSTFETILEPNGQIFITVPNGYGWFEAEAWANSKTSFAKFLYESRIAAVLNKFKKWFFGYEPEAYPSSLDSSPHVQRFTLRRLKDLLASKGYQVEDARGSGLIAGPISNVFFSGIPILTRLNNWLGNAMPNISSGFYIAGRKLR